MTGAGNARVHRPTLLRVIRGVGDTAMTAEHDNAKPTFTVVTPMSGEATPLRTRAKRCIEQT